jgi:hypothetical protein
MAGVSALHAPYDVAKGDEGKNPPGRCFFLMRECSGD